MIVKSALLLQEKELLTEQTRQVRNLSGRRQKSPPYQDVFLLRDLPVFPAEVKTIPCNENDRPDDDAYH